MVLGLSLKSEKKQRRMDEEMEGKIWAFSDMDDVGFRFTSSSSYGRSSQFISSSIAGPGVNPFLTKSFAISGLTPDWTVMPEENRKCFAWCLVPGAWCPTYPLPDYPSKPWSDLNPTYHPIMLLLHPTRFWADSMWISVRLARFNLDLGMCVVRSFERESIFDLYMFV